MPDRARTRELVDVLDVRRHLVVGLTVGGIVAAAAYVYRVDQLAGPNPATRGSPMLFLMLAFVLAVTLGLLVTAILTVRSAVALGRSVDDDGPH